jgi:dihydrofolate reductase
MSRIVHYVHQSADGFIEGPNGEFDWPTMGPELSAHSEAMSNAADVFLYGRVVWDMMASYWPAAEEHSDHPHDLAFAPVWRAKRKVVVSRTLGSADWNTTVLSTVDELAAFKEQPGNDMIMFGGTELAASLTERGLIDEYQIFVHPVVLGGGKPVFTDAKRFALRLVESKVVDEGVVLLRYER